MKIKMYRYTFKETEVGDDKCSIINTYYQSKWVANIKYKAGKRLKIVKIEEKIVKVDE